MTRQIPIIKSQITNIIVIIFLILFSAHQNAYAAKIAHTSPPALIVMPDDGFKPLEQILTDAGKSLDIVIHRLDDPRMLKAISNTAKRGVKVRVMLEKNPTGTIGDGAKARKNLEDAGAFTKWADPKFGSTFQRTAIVDGSAAYVLTFDLTQQAIDTARGLVIKLVDPREVEEIAKTFQADWNRDRITSVSAKLAWAPRIARMKISDLLRGTVHSLDIYSERIQDRVVVREIGNAIERGVAVKVLVGDDEENANRPGITRLRQLGARVRVMEKPKLMTNMILADAGHKAQVALIGSVDLASFSLDEHRGLSAFISDEGRLDQIKKIFEKDWERSGSRLKDEKLNHK